MSVETAEPTASTRDDDTHGAPGPSLVPRADPPCQTTVDNTSLRDASPVSNGGACRTKSVLSTVAVNSVERLLGGDGPQEACGRQLRDPFADQFFSASLLPEGVLFTAAKFGVAKFVGVLIDMVVRQQPTAILQPAHLSVVVSELVISKLVELEGYLKPNYYKKVVSAYRPHTLIVVLLNSRLHCVSS